MICSDPGDWVSGKRDQTSHDAAIEKLTEALSHSGVIKAHLSKILDDAAFKGSRRSREFLTHVVECALAGQWSRLKERSLGIEVFGRDPSYDTGGDSIVRVTASDVRRRLLQYYSETAGTESLRIEIPAGSYIPEFSGLEGPVRRAVRSEDAPDHPSESYHRRLNDWPGTADRIVSPASPSSSQGRARRVALSILVVCFGWLLGLLSARFVFRSSAKTESRYEFYRELLGPIATDPANETEIALSNPRLWLYTGSNNSQNPSLPSTMSARVPPDLEKLLNSAVGEGQAPYAFHFLTLADQEYTEIGEAVAAFNLSQLMRRLGRAPRLTESRFLNWRALRNDHLMLLGASLVNAWAQENPEPANFALVQDSIVNARPAPGEQQIYRRSVQGNILEDYGLIWMARSPSGSQQLLMAGLTSAGTAGISDFFCDPERMRPVYQRLRALLKRGKVASDWQLLLHIHARENVPLRVNVVSLRVGGESR